MLCLVGGQGAGKSTFFRLLAVRDEWFSDDLRKLDDENVYRKLQGHWIIEMSEMMATANGQGAGSQGHWKCRQTRTDGGGLPGGFHRVSCKPLSAGLKMTYFLNALGVGGCHHFRHFDNPVVYAPLRSVLNRCPLDI